MKKDPEDENEFMDGFFKWCESEQGQQSTQAMDYVFEALQGADLNLTERKIIWPDGEHLTIDQSVRKINKRTAMNIEAIRSHVIGWLEMEYEPKDLNDEQMLLFESQIEEWIQEYKNTILK